MNYIAGQQNDCYMRKTIVFCAGALVCTMMLIGCVDAHYQGPPFDFWDGVWHGATASISFVGMLFSDDVVIKAASNKTEYYNSGFWIGVFWPILLPILITPVFTLIALIARLFSRK